jgi:hypothetical protein
VLTYISIWDEVASKNLHIHHLVDPQGIAKIFPELNLKIEVLSYISPHLTEQLELHCWYCLLCFFYSSEFAFPYVSLLIKYWFRFKIIYLNSLSLKQLFHF